MKDTCNIGDVVRIGGRRLRIIGCIQEGTEGRIFSAQLADGGEGPAFVAKSCVCRRGDERWERAMKEIEAGQMLQKCRHAVRLLGHGVRTAGERTEIILLMERLACCADLHPEAPEIWRMCADICDALEAMRSRELVHGDIKPSNLYYREGDGWQLGDFGSVCRRGEIPVYGSEGYCSPEAWRGKACDSRSDIYSLGVTLYQMLSGGRLPFCDKPCDESDDAAVYAAIERRMRGEPIPPLACVNGECNALLRKMCAFEPKERFRTPAALARRIRRWGENEMINAKKQV